MQEREWACPLYFSRAASGGGHAEAQERIHHVPGGGEGQAGRAGWVGGSWDGGGRRIACAGRTQACEPQRAHVPQCVGAHRSNSAACANMVSRTSGGRCSWCGEQSAEGRRESVHKANRRRGHRVQAPAPAPPPPPAPTRCAMASRSSGIIGRRKVPLSAGVRLCPMGSVMFSNTSSGLHALRWGWGWGQEAGRGVGWLHRAPMWARPTAARHALVDPVDLPPPAHPSPAPWPHQQGHNLALLLLQVIAHHGGQPPERRLRLRQQLGLGGGALGCQGPGPEV